jgi:hypothetical protein
MLRLPNWKTPRTSSSLAFLVSCVNAERYSSWCRAPPGGGDPGDLFGRHLFQGVSASKRQESFLSLENSLDPPNSTCRSRRPPRANVIAVANYCAGPLQIFRVLPLAKTAVGRTVQPAGTHPELPFFAMGARFC